MHTCAKPGWEGRWLTRDIIRAAYRTLDELGVRYVVAIHDDPANKRMLKRLGFVLGDRVNVLDLKELDNGRNCGIHLWSTRYA